MAMSVQTNMGAITALKNMNTKIMWVSPRLLNFYLMNQIANRYLYG